MSRFTVVGGSVTSLVENVQRQRLVLPIHVGTNGYVQNAGFTIRPVPALERGPMDGPRAIVLHRTDSSTAAGTMRSFARGVGTHFLVDKDGTVTQAASLLQKAAHVGKIQSRCRVDRVCPADEARMIEGWGWAPSRVHGHEKKKAYPARYPMNEDSVGIETVALFDRTSKQWERPTEDQSRSIARLIAILKNEYGLSDADIYEHDAISYKEPGEGAGLYDGGGATDGMPVRFSPPFF